MCNPKYIHTYFQVSGYEKGTAKRGTGLRRCVYTNPHQHTTTTGRRASDEDERNTHTHTPTKPRKVGTYICVEVSSIKQKLKGEKLVTTSENKQPAGHGPGKRSEKFERKFRTCVGRRQKNSGIPAIIRMFVLNLCAHGPQRGPTHIGAQY